MKKLEAFQQGDGAHCGLSDWYKEGEAELADAVAARIPFDTGWYSSKKEIASARIWSEDGVKIKVEAFVSDDLDTEGLGYASTDEWTVDAIASAISTAWEKAEAARDENQEYEGFTVLQHRQDQDWATWVETYLINIGWGESVFPPGDNYHWWGWQCDQVGEQGEGIPHPDIPLETVQAFERWANDFAFRTTDAKSLTIGEWTIKPWRESRPQPEDQSDYAGMGWVGRDGRP